MCANAHICAGQRTTLCILTETQSLRYVLRKGFLLAWISPNRLGWLSGTVCLWPWNCKHIFPHLSPLIKSRLASKYVAKDGIVLPILLGLQVCTPHLVYALLGTNPGPSPCRTSDVQPELPMAPFIYLCLQLQPGGSEELSLCFTLL